MMEYWNAGQKGIHAFLLLSSFHYSNIPVFHVILGNTVSYEILKFKFEK
jgi:hypothetical protein